MVRSVVPGARRGRLALAGLVALWGLSGFGSAPGRYAFAEPSRARQAKRASQQQAQRAEDASDSDRRIEPADTLESAKLQAQFRAVARRVAPAVVAISAVDTPVESDRSVHSDRLNPDTLSGILDSVDRIVGTGFIVDGAGYIVTNDHVVGKAEQVWVTTDDHKVYPAIVVGTDPRADIAVLKIPATRLPTVRFAKSDSVERGQWTLTLGNPYGLASAGEMSLSVGVVSATGRSLPKLAGKEDRLYSDLIQTTAQINPGNSGGPLLDLDGNVIGINSAVILPQKTTNGIGFAIPAGPRVQQVIESLKQGREVVYGYLGARVSTATGRERREAGIAGEAGAHVDSVDLRSPAEGKLRKDDIVLKIGGETIRDGDHFVRAIGSSPVDRPVSVVLYRGNRAKTIALSLKRRELPLAAVTRQTQRFRWKGLLLGPIPRVWDFKDQPRPGSGLMVLAMEPSSPLAKQGVRQGAVITTVAGNPVADVQALQKILDDTPDEKCAICVAGSGDAIASIKEDE